MKLSRIIERFFNKEEFCYPLDFFWMNKDSVKEKLKSKKLLSIITLFTYFALATLAFIGYYLLLPFRLLHEWCEEWCYG